MNNGQYREYNGSYELQGCAPSHGGWGSVVVSVLHIPQVIFLADMTKDQIHNPLNDSPVLYQDNQAPESFV